MNTVQNAVFEIIHERVGDKPLYITFDLDCLDPVFAPGVANLEPAIERVLNERCFGTAARDARQKYYRW
ncbi:MAG: hypothetical protein CM1200mP30_10850 [Pseudomonadota bacterium]|nr:MAG: hypothetical protein CM1200mP30_10850 [Pseudomonadota bacterium]